MAFSQLLGLAEFMGRQVSDRWDLYIEIIANPYICLAGKAPSDFRQQFNPDNVFKKQNYEERLWLYHHIHQTKKL